MKHVKVKRFKAVHKPSGLGWGYRARFRVGLRWLITLLPLLPVLALVMIFLLPQTPHLRISYSYTGTYEHPIYRECNYLGIHGFIRVLGPDCPLVAFI